MLIRSCTLTLTLSRARARDIWLPFPAGEGWGEGINSAHTAIGATELKHCHVERSEASQ